MVLYELSAGAIIFLDLRFLILHYPTHGHYHGHWDFIKGNIENDEKPEDCVRREAQEEAGISDLFFIKDFKEKIKFFYKKEGQLVMKEVIFFLAETKTKEVKLSEEHVGYAWLDYEHALQRLTFKNSKELLIKANKFLLKGRMY